MLQRSGHKGVRAFVDNVDEMLTSFYQHFGCPQTLMVPIYYIYI